MISSGRYAYHLQDIAEIKAMPEPREPTQEFYLRHLEQEAAEFEAANPEETKRIQALARR